jgi:4'-phosphopantetheinyl transferase
MPFTLSANEVHVWQAKLDDHDAGGLRDLLAADEIARADRFHFAKDRNHYIVARALLRKLLAAYLEINAEAVRLSYAEKGKPFLTDPAQSTLKFNVAHSHGLALYAFSPGREVGIDLEFIKEDLESEEIAERFFSPREVQVLMTIPAHLRKRAFFDCWTRKEAYIKARGEGLSMPLDQFDVSFAPGEPAALLRNDQEPVEVARWTMRNMTMPLGYVAALVAEGDDWDLQTFAVEPGRGVQTVDQD